VTSDDTDDSLRICTFSCSSIRAFFSVEYLQVSFYNFYKMKNNKLGNTNIEVAPLAFGGNVFGWTIDEEKSFELLDAFVDKGFNLIDTADVYSRWKPGNKGGESEAIIGNWLKKSGKRSKVIIATKVGSDMGEGKNLTKAYILKEADASLKRLQTDYIDLYQTHFDDEKTPVEETLEAYNELVKAGKVKYIGASNMSAARLQESLEVSDSNGFARYQTFQPEYNLYAREHFEKEYATVCLENNISVISYYSLASGFLTGKYRNETDLKKSPRGEGAKKFLNERGFKILKALDDISAAYNSSQAAVALAWLMNKPSIAAPIASATSVQQLDEITKAADLNLSEEAMKILDDASAW
jgi:aryl-alcohol dehydrogenase-like predicted oxidoreductase